MADPRPGPATSRVAWNAGIGMVSQVASLLLSLLTTPIILHALGVGRFGLYAVIGSLTAYFGVLDLGIGGSLTRYMTFHSERGEVDRVRAIATFGTGFYLVLALLLLPVVHAVSPGIARLLGLGEGPERPALLIQYVFALFILSSLNGVLGARLASLHRLDLVSAANFAGALVFAGCVVGFGARLGSVAAVLGCVGIQIGVAAALSYAFARRVAGGPLLANPVRMTWAGTRELFNFGLWTQVNNLASVVNLEADKAIISRGIGPAQVSPYHVANRLALMNRVLPLQMLGSLLPDVTARISRRPDAAEVERIYRRASRALMLATLVMSGMLAGSADVLLRLWLGIRLPGAAMICVALVASYAVNNATGLGTTILRAQGRPQVETVYALLSVAINVGVTVALIRPYGLRGVVAGTICGNVAGSVFFLWMFHRLSGIGWWRSMGGWLARLVAATAAAALLVHLFLHMVAGAADGWRVLLPAVVAGGCVYLAAFAALLALLGYPDEHDRLLMRRLLDRGLRRRAA